MVGRQPLPKTIVTGVKGFRRVYFDPMVTSAMGEAVAPARSASPEARAAGKLLAPSTLQRIRQLIVHGRLAPGSRIIEADLAKRLGVSRTPVREALYRLQQDGYIVGFQASGRSRMSVAPLTQADAGELYQIVGHLEGLAARRAATLAPSRRQEIAVQLEELNATLQGLDQPREAQEAGFLELDMAFHQIIVEAAAGPRLLAISSAVKPQVERYWRLYASAMADGLGPSVEEHAHIIAGIRTGDADSAEHWVRKNWENGAIRLGRIISTHGEHGHW